MAAVHLTHFKLTSTRKDDETERHRISPQDFKKSVLSECTVLYFESTVLVLGGWLKRTLFFLKLWKPLNKLNDARMNIAQ